MTLFKTFFAPPTIPESPVQQVFCAHSCAPSFQHGGIPPNSLQLFQLLTTFLHFVLLPRFPVHTYKLSVSGFSKFYFLYFMNFPLSLQKGEKERELNLIQQRNKDKHCCVVFHPLLSSLSFYIIITKQTKRKKQNKTKSLRNSLTKKERTTHLQNQGSYQRKHPVVKGQHGRHHCLKYIVPFMHEA